MECGACGTRNAWAPVGRRSGAFDLTLPAAFADHEGTLDVSVARFRDAIVAAESTDGTVPAMVLGAVLAESMPQRSEARKAARDAHDWFCSKHAEGYLRLFGDEWRRVLDQTRAG